MSDLESNHLPGSFFAKCGVSIVLVAVVVALVYGRSLAERYTWLVASIPYLGLTSLAVIAIFVWCTVRYRIKETKMKPLRQSLLTMSFASFVVVVSSLLLCELLIQLPIERIHFVKYGSLAILVFFSQQSSKLIQRLTISMLLTAAIGVLEESAQYFIPNRVFDLRDILLNSSAALSGTAISAIIYLWLNIEMRHTIDAEDTSGISAGKARLRHRYTHRK